MGQPRLLDMDWNNACTVAKEISWAVCGCEEREGGQKTDINMFLRISTIYCNCYCLFYLDVLPILCLQQALIITFNAKGEVRTGNNVSPVAPDSHFVPLLSRHTQS